MSATNRGMKRIDSDFYATPEATISNFLIKYNSDMNEKKILEPSAGNGNFIKVIKNMYPNSIITANEIREEENKNLKLYSDNVTHLDFLKFDKTEDYDFIIGNPPYSLAIEFIQKCLEISTTNTVTILLLRTAFLESKKRYGFWQKHPVNHLYVLSQRPSFMGKGTDATSYSFFVWDGSNNQSIHVI
jgi:hypothetical protein